MDQDFITKKKLFIPFIFLVSMSTISPEKLFSTGASVTVVFIMKKMAADSFVPLRFPVYDSGNYLRNETALTISTITERALCALV